MADSAAATTIIYIANTCPKISSNNNEFVNIINVMDSNITSIDININIMFFLLNTKDSTLIRNNDKAININVNLNCL